MIKTISVWDFDGTLCRSIEPSEDAKKQWESVHNRPWPHKGTGWWSKMESLCIDTFNPQLIERVKSAALDAINDPHTYTVLLTGRYVKFQKIVKEILRLNGMPYFDAYYFNDIHDTLTFKLKILENLKIEFTEAETLIMWEDREAHIPKFIEWGKLNYGEKFFMNIVKKGE